MIADSLGYASLTQPTNRSVQVVMRKMPRNYSKSDGITPVDMMHCAIDHLSASELLFESHPSHYDSAGYLAHLGIEMILKSILLYKGGEFPGIHNISDLYNKLHSKGFINKLPVELEKVISTLDGYEYLRYPNLDSPVEIGTDDLILVKKLANFLEGQMPVGLVSELSQLNSSENNAPISKAGRILMRKARENT